jgi:hypothetical protein
LTPSTVTVMLAMRGLLPVRRIRLTANLGR